MGGRKVDPVVKEVAGGADAVLVDETKRTASRPERG
jgi:hypothetical protein